MYVNRILKSFPYFSTDLIKTDSFDAELTSDQSYDLDLVCFINLLTFPCCFPLPFKH